MTDFSLVCLVSTYREGPLVAGTIRSCLEAGFDRVAVFEGPAGPERCDDAPESELEPFYRDADVFRGSWVSDAEKHTHALEWARKHYPGVLWVMWMGGDELLFHGSSLRDIAQSILWQDEARGASLASLIRDGEAPTGGGVVYLLEADGALSLMRGRLVRGDLIRRYLVGDLVCELVTGVQARLGNIRVSAAQWIEERGEPLEQGWAYLPPPLPGEPFVYHRSHLRHPARRMLRMHEQEAAELERLGLPVGSNGR